MNLNSLIDHTLLKPTATADDIKKLCQEAKDYGFWSVCVNPVWVKLAKEQGVRVTSVIGFPLGANTMAVKVAEIKQAISDGADEVDMVISQAGNILEEVRSAVKAAQGKTVKIIIETCYLTDKEKVLAARLVKQGGADFVKTSTGFGTPPVGGQASGATVEDVKLLRQAVGKDFGVKASGGIKTREQAEAMIKAGANRIGTSSGVEICR